MQHTHPHLRPLPPPQNLSTPSEQLIAPSASDQHSTNHINDPDEQSHEAAPLLPDGEEYGLDVELEEDAGYVALVDEVALRRDGVLVGEDCGGGGGARVGGAGVDGRDDGAVVLVFEEV